MSLYHTLHGTHPLAPMLMPLLGYRTRKDADSIPRFRDVFLFQNEIRLLTRSGGGNRVDYVDENQALRKRRGFLRDWDDDYDSTFAWWAYMWPEALPQASLKGLQALLDVTIESRPDLLPDSLEAMTKKATLKYMAKILDSKRTH